MTSNGSSARRRTINDIVVTGGGQDAAMHDDETGHQTLVRLYLLQAEECNQASSEVAAHWDEAPLPGDDEADAPASAAVLDMGDERTYAEALIADAQRASGCSCDELLAAGYAMRQWVQRRPLADQSVWLRATQCPHVTLVDGLAGADFAGHRAARDWYTLAVTLRRVTLDGDVRVPLINDYVLDWIEENTSYLV